MGNKSSKNCLRVRSYSNDLIDTNESSSIEKLSLIWLNCSLPNLASPELLPLLNEFQDDTGDLLKVFDDEVDCYGFIRKTAPNKKLLIIVPSGQPSNYLVPLTYRFCQVAAIFIYYLSDEDRDDERFEYCKTKVKWTPVSNLIKRIQHFQGRWLRHWDAHSLSIDVFKLSNKKDLSSSGINGNFLFFQLLIDTFLQMKCEPIDMNEFIELCAKEFSNNERLLDSLQKFSNDYKPEDALRWYTKPIFLYSLLNEALRKQNFELLFLLRFFIRDIHCELKRNQCQLPTKVYRGQLISLEEIQLLKSSIGDLISMKSFFSTSLDRKKAEFYISGATLTSANKSHSDLVPVLLIITIDSDLNGNEERPFANITEFSEFSDDEEEVLFMAGSVYRVLAYEEEDNKHILSLQLSVTIEEDMQMLLRYLKANRKIAADSNTSLVAFVDILQDLDKTDLVEKFARRALDEISLTARSEPVNVLDIAKCYLYLGRIALNRDQVDEALKQFNIALKYVLLMAEPDSQALAAIYATMAATFELKHRYDDVLHYYNKALNTLEQNENENASKLATIYTNLGQFHRSEKNYERARWCHKKALILRENCLPEMHYDLAFTYKGLAAIHFDLHEYDQALIHCQKALDIESKSLPLDHPTLAVTYEHMTVIYEQIGDVERAKDFMVKARTIDRRSTMVPRSRFLCTMYICPWCEHHVWIYSVFRFVKELLAFVVLVKRLVFVDNSYKFIYLK